MKILVTGANGFMGKNLISQLENIRDGKAKSQYLSADIEVLPYDIGCSEEALSDYCRQCDFVVHLAGVNRPKDTSQFRTDNVFFTQILVDYLEKHSNNCPIVFSSSIQAELDNEYGRSKLEAEELLREHSQRTGSKLTVYRFSNVFGKWSKPNYNSVVATFCYNIARDMPITISDRAKKIVLVYIDDVVDEMIKAISGKPTLADDFGEVGVKHLISLGELADTIYGFKQSRQTLSVPDCAENSLKKKLYSTYLSFLPEDGFAYPLKMNVDQRGSFTEILKTANNGQFSVNISRPHIIKGEHWHHTKNEKFLVVSGTGVIRFRKIDSDEIIEYFVSGEKLRVVDIPTGYTHNIENLGDTDMVTFMWCNECFNPEKPDTYFLKVSQENVLKSDKKKILVLGAGGMAGHIVYKYFEEQGYDVTGFDTREIPNTKCIVGDVFNTDGFKHILRIGNYDAVLNCIGLLNRACDENYSAALYLNAYLPHLICEALKDVKTKVVHISTDCVFKGDNSPYDENAFKDADDNYGRTKALGEIDGENHVTFRTSIVGPDTRENGPSLMNWFMSQSSSVTGFSNAIWTGVSTLTLAKAMEYAVNNDCEGVYNLVNNTPISKYELLKLFNKHLRSGSIEVLESEGTPTDKTLVSTRELGFKVPSYEDMIKEIGEWINTHKELYPHYFK